MSSPNRGLQSVRILEEKYFAEIDQILLQNLREAMELQEEVSQAISRQDAPCERSERQLHELELA